MQNNCICIIPARGGSKRIPKKNIKNFCGKPIILFSIEAAQKSNLFTKIIVSTDDELIINVVKNTGVEIHNRSIENASDIATTMDVLVEVRNDLEQHNFQWELGCCIYPCAPFVNEKLLNQLHKKIESKMINCVFPAVRYGHPVQRAFAINESGKTQLQSPEFINTNSQHLTPMFHDSGQCYFFKKEAIFKEANLIQNNSYAIEIAETQTQDIDNETDWELAEIKWKRING